MNTVIQEPVVAVPVIPVKPSQVLYAMDERRRCQHRLREESMDGSVKVCAIGALGEAIDFDWGESNDIGYEWVEFAIYPLRIWVAEALHLRIGEVWGLSREMLNEVIELSDHHSFRAAAEYLESIGK